MARKWTPDGWRAKPIKQQPEWPDAAQVEAVEDKIRTYPPLVFAGEARNLRAHLAKVADGKAFPDVAKKFSKGPRALEGGLWPLMEQGSLRDEEVEKAAFAQKPGEVSGVIETANGFYVLKTIKRLPGELTAFEEVQKQIQEKLHTQQYNKLSSEYMAKFEKKAILQAADKFKAAAADAAVRRYLRR